MTKLSNTPNNAKGNDGGDTLLNVIQEPSVQKSWSEAFQSAVTAVRETRDAWRRFS
jgi:hypothetical protein